MQRSIKGSNPRPPKGTPLQRKLPLLESQGDHVQSLSHAPQSLTIKKGQKTTKRSVQNEIPISSSDSWPDASNSGNEYRALRHKYLLLEEESFALGREFREVENEAKTLEEEKLALLDSLILLEGLIDPSEVKSEGLNLPQAFTL